MKKLSLLISVLMVFVFVITPLAPVMAEELNDNGEDMEEPSGLKMPSSINIREMEGRSADYYAKNVNYFKYDDPYDGTYYYNLNIGWTNIHNKDEIYKKVMFKYYPDLKGYSGMEEGYRSTIPAQWVFAGVTALKHSGQLMLDENRKRWYTYNLREVTANNLKDAENEIFKDSNRHEKRAFSNDTKNQKVYAVKEEISDGDRVNPYKNYTVAAYVYNVRVSPVLNDDYIQWARKNKKTEVQDKIKSNQTTSTASANNTPLSVNSSNTVSVSKSESQSKTDNGSFSHSYTESLKVGVKKDIKKLFELSAEIGFSATQALSRGWSKSESTTYTENKTTTQSVSVPGYTGISMSQTKAEGEYVISQDTPMTISYDVKLVNYGEKGQDMPKVFTYEANKDRGSEDARSDLYQRAYKGKENQGLRYLTAEDGASHCPYSAEDTVNKVARFVPYFNADKVKNNGKLNDTAMSTHGFIALHPLKSVDTLKGQRETEIKNGSKIYLRDIELAGYLDPKYSDGKSGTAQYATFNRNKGEWVVTAGQDCVEITTDSQKNQVLTGKKAGQAVITYRIDENSYNSAEDRTKFTKNSELTKTAVYNIKVSDTEKASARGYHYNVETVGPKNPQNSPIPEQPVQDVTQEDGMVLLQPVVDTPQDKLEVVQWKDNLQIAGSETPDASAITSIKFKSDDTSSASVGCTVQMISGAQKNANPGETAGDENGQDFIEAFKLTNANAANDNSELRYRAFIQGEGWTGWARENEFAGSHGLGKPITAIQVALVGEYEQMDMFINDQEAYVVADSYGEINYSANVGQARDGQILGNPQGDTLLNSIRVSTDPTKAGVGITVTTEGEMDKIEALTMQLSGENSGIYDLFYRVYSEETGWMNWARAGEKAGTSGLNQGIKAMQAMLLKAGETPDNSDYTFDTIASYEANVSEAPAITE